MSFSAIKRNLTDALFSDIVRVRNHWICERCGRSFEQKKHLLDASHYITRGNKRTRWDFDNVSCLCRGCHQLFGKNPFNHTYFMEKKLGKRGLEALVMRAERNLNSIPIDEKLIRQGLKIELARLKREESSEIIGAR